MKTAHFTVTNPKTNEVVAKYKIDYETISGLKSDFEESRQVWSEYIVTVDTDEFHLSESHTWRDEFLAKNF